MNEQAEEAQVFPELKVTEEMRSYWYQMTKWAYFLAIVGFIIAIFMVMLAFSIEATMKANPQLAAMLGSLEAGKGDVLKFVFFIYAALIFYPSLLLFRFAKQGKQGVLYGDQEALDQSLGKIKSLFKYFGFITLIFIFQSLFSVFAGLLAK